MDRPGVRPSPVATGQWRWKARGGDGTYRHVSGLFLGSISLMAAGYGLTALANRHRQNAAAADSVACRRDQQPARVMVTDRWLLDTIPLRLYGYAAPAIAVWSTAMLHGVPAVLTHPGLQPLVGDAIGQRPSEDPSSRAIGPGELGPN